MTTRKSPYEHKVGPHYREGKYIETYHRGNGEAPQRSVSVRSVNRGGGSIYNVVFTFPDGGTESYNVSGTATGALKAAIGKIQRPVLPKRAYLTLLGGD